jgi:phasin family protein
MPLCGKKVAFRWLVLFVSGSACLTCLSILIKVHLCSATISVCGFEPQDDQPLGVSMSFNNQEISALGQAQFDKAVRLSSIVLSSAERLATLQLDLTRKLLADQAQNFKSLTEIKDPKALVEFQASLAQPSLDQAFSVARNVYDAAVETQSELTAFIEDQVAENNKTLISTLDRLSKNAPAGSDIAVSAIKTLVNQSSAAFDSVSKTAQKVGAEMAEAGVQAATNSAKAASAAVARKKSGSAA